MVIACCLCSSFDWADCFVLLAFCLLLGCYISVASVVCNVLDLGLVAFGWLVGLCLLTFFGNADD